ncbi:hypothetical protein H920_04591 [Fukomys damarensis]|uniref:Uncharacterized protein n=1 Tax=Fukomys damarensis TaxID=885580 RepID=A0A091DUI2_FUKDA|nr:hypothetical protein H920_04591 [Fukomys damarensis]
MLLSAGTAVWPQCNPNTYKTKANVLGSLLCPHPAHTTSVLLQTLPVLSAAHHEHTPTYDRGSRGRVGEAQEEIGGGLTRVILTTPPAPVTLWFLPAGETPESSSDLHVTATCPATASRVSYRLTVMLPPLCPEPSQTRGSP